MVDVHLVVDPWTRESRGFGFVTMETVEDAGRCVKYLNRSVLEGRVITVEKVYLLSSILFLFGFLKRYLQVDSPDSVCGCVALSC